MERILGIPNYLCQGLPNFNGVRLAYMKTWHDRLKFAREQAGIKADALADKVGVTSASVSDWESGETKKIEGENLIKVCDFLKINPHWLLFGKGLMHGTKPRLVHLNKMLEDQPDYVIDEAIKNIASDIELLKKAKNNGTQ